MGTIVGAAIGALSGLIVGLSVALSNYVVSQRKREDELFASAIAHLGGGSQQRNLGIAAFTLYLRQFSRHRGICADLLVGSAIYLLNQSEQEDAAHELFNLERIMNLLKGLASERGTPASYEHLRVAIAKRVQNFNPKPKKGLWVKEGDLKKWQLELNATRSGGGTNPDALGEQKSG